MDFFGFHPLYVVILLALALIIFGPSRLPKMGAQMGRMLREFQAAREGLTQQMRDAFEEEPENTYAGSTGPVEEEEAEAESGGATVAVLDPPPGGQSTPEALGTAVDGAGDGPWEGFTPVTADGNGTPEGVAPEEPDAAAGLDTPAVVGTAPETPAEGTTAEEPETAAALSSAPEQAAAASEAQAAALDTPAEATVEEPETAAALSSGPEQAGAGASEAQAAPLDTPAEGTAEEPETAANLDPPAEAAAAAGPEQPEVKAGAVEVPGSDSVAPPVVTGEAGADAPSSPAGNPFAWVAADHEPTPELRDEEPRGDQ